MSSQWPSSHSVNMKHIPTLTRELPHLGRRGIQQWLSKRHTFESKIVQVISALIKEIIESSKSPGRIVNNPSFIGFFFARSFSVVLSMSP